METINSVTDLKSAILQLENKQDDECKMLRAQFHLAYESVKPINLIKSTFREVAESGELKNNLLNTSVGLTAGFLSKTLFVGMSTNPLKKMLGNALLFGITNMVTKNPDTVKLIGRGIFNIFRRKSSRR